MKILSVFIGLLFTISLCLIGCSSMNSMGFNCDELRLQKNISKQIEVNVEDTFTVNLCSNASTGFRWLDSANISDQTIVKQIDHKNIAPSKAMPGAPGQQVWTFKALKKGTVQITNEYSQPWSGGQKSAWNLTLDIMVK
jgi:predicted secreted protein